LTDFYNDVFIPYATYALPVIGVSMVAFFASGRRPGWRNRFVRAASFTGGVTGNAYAFCLMLNWLVASMIEGTPLHPMLQAIPWLASPSFVRSYLPVEPMGWIGEVLFLIWSILSAHKYWEFLTNPPSAIIWNLDGQETAPVATTLEG
jgi:hypothetical protein